MEKKEEALKILNLGIKEYKKDNFQLSTEYFEKASLLFPKNIGILENLALSLYSQGKFENSIDVLNKALNQNGDDEKAFELLQKIYKETNNKNKLIVDKLYIKEELFLLKTPIIKKDIKAIVLALVLGAFLVIILGA